VARMEYTWDMESLSEARLPKKKRRIDYTKVGSVISDVKALLRKESDPDVRRSLAEAGMALSRILLK
jgi:hypothetical protein